jgi:solute carrier family 25 uncoupling protein 8/9
LVDCFKKTVAEEGFAALYKGFVPALARQGPVMVIQMPIVEQLRLLAGLDYF